MGYLMSESETPGTEEYHVELRRESFILTGDSCFDYIYEGKGDPPKHTFGVVGYLYNPVDEKYLDKFGHDRAFFGSFSAGHVEILIEDIPKIRACLDAVERKLNA